MIGPINFEWARLNKGDAFDLASGIFTVPVPGIYHFDFSAVKYQSAQSLDISLLVNGANVGKAYTHSLQTPGSLVVASLSASLQLAAGDTVNLYLYEGALYDSEGFTHFSGWLVEEDLM